MRLAATILYPILMCGSLALAELRHRAPVRRERVGVGWAAIAAYLAGCAIALALHWWWNAALVVGIVPIWFGLALLKPNDWRDPARWQGPARGRD